MDWLEITVVTAPTGIDALASALTAAGFDDLLLEDQAELETFLEQNLKLVLWVKLLRSTILI